MTHRGSIIIKVLLYVYLSSLHYNPEWILSDFTTCLHLFRSLPTSIQFSMPIALRYFAIFARSRPRGRFPVRASSHTSFILSPGSLLTWPVRWSLLDFIYFTKLVSPNKSYNFVGLYSIVFCRLFKRRHLERCFPKLAITRPLFFFMFSWSFDCKMIC